MSGNDWNANLQSYTNLLQSQGDDVALPSPDDIAASSPLHRRSSNTPTPQPRPLFPHPPPPYPYASPPYPYPPPPYPYAPPPYPPPPESDHAPPAYPFGAYGYAPPPPPPTLRPCPISTASESEGGGSNPTPVPARPRRLEYTVEEDEKLINAWLKHSIDPIAENSRTGAAFWGDITRTFNSTSELARHRTLKQLKDRWTQNNPNVVLFTCIYSQEERHRRSGADDAMVMMAAKEKYRGRAKGKEFRLEHWWHFLFC